MTFKDLAKEMYLEGYRQNASMEKLSDLGRKTAERQFETYWEQNHE